MLLAMAEHQLKEFDAARITLNKGLQMGDEKMLKAGEDLHDSWDDWLIAHFLISEAAALMPEVVASNNAYAKLATEPAWQTALRRAGLKFSGYLQTDGTWDCDLNDQPISDLSLLRGAPITRLCPRGNS